jgi:transposase-like protein
LYRAVDRDGKTVDFRLSTRRDVAAVKAFFRKAIKSHGSTPRTITLDGYAASHLAVRDMKVDGQLPADTKLRSSQYLNNLIEQDHRRAAQILVSEFHAPINNSDTKETRPQAERGDRRDGAHTFRSARAP